MRRSTQHETRPLRLAASARVAVTHDEVVATEYDLHIPVRIRGLRIRVKDILDLLASGASREETSPTIPTSSRRTS